MHDTFIFHQPSVLCKRSNWTNTFKSIAFVKNLNCISLPWAARGCRRFPAPNSTLPTTFGAHTDLWCPCPASSKYISLWSLRFFDLVLGCFVFWSRHNLTVPTCTTTSPRTFPRAHTLFNLNCFLVATPLITDQGAPFGKVCFWQRKGGVNYWHFLAPFGGSIIHCCRRRLLVGYVGGGTHLPSWGRVFVGQEAAKDYFFGFNKKFPRIVAPYILLPMRGGGMVSSQPTDGFPLYLANKGLFVPNKIQHTRGYKLKSQPVIRDRTRQMMPYADLPMVFFSHPKVAEWNCVARISFPRSCSNSI